MDDDLSIGSDFFCSIPFKLKKFRPCILCIKVHDPGARFLSAGILGARFLSPGRQMLTSCLLGSWVLGSCLLRSWVLTSCLLGANCWYVGC